MRCLLEEIIIAGSTKFSLEESRRKIHICIILSFRCTHYPQHQHKKVVRFVVWSYNGHKRSKYLVLFYWILSGMDPITLHPKYENRFQVSCIFSNFKPLTNLKNCVWLFSHNDEVHLFCKHLLELGS